MERRIEAGHFETFRQWLVEEKREPAIIEKYLWKVRAFAAWLGGDQVTKEQVAMWKKQLGCQPATVNRKLSALNKFFSFLGWQGCRVKHLKIQQRVFCSRGRELNREEYIRLLETAKVLGVNGWSFLLKPYALQWSEPVRKSAYQQNLYEI